MKPFVLALSDPQATLETVGGKGMSLAKLIRAGLPVPGGFHVTTEAYRQFVEANDLQPKILDALKKVDAADPAALETASKTIGACFEQGGMPALMSDAIIEAYLAVGADSPIVAVRSSATAEDLPEASFAGQQETYLNVHGPEDVLDAVRKCWASLWTARAIAYRIKNNIDQNSVALAVVVQEMVFAEASGILFTANPITGNRAEAVINAAWGLGEAIVSGSVTPDTLTVDRRRGKVIHRSIAEKKVMTVRSDMGVNEVPVPLSRKKKAVLGSAQASVLTRYGDQIEALYGMPMDIEWTLAEKSFAIVQARPITSLPEPLEWNLPHPKAVLARGSFAEFVPEPISPLFGTLAVPIARRTTIELMSEFGVTGENGYLFEVLNDYVYVGFIFTPGFMWQMLKASLLLLGPIMRTVRKRADAAREGFLATIQKWQSDEPEKLSPVELLLGVREIFTQTAKYYNMAQSGTIPTAMMAEVIFSWYYTALVKRRGDPEPSIFVYGADNHALRSEKALHDLAMWAGKQPGLVDFMMRASAEEFCSALRLDFPPVPAMAEFSTRFDAYLAEFGHAVYDLDFAKPVPADSPAPLIDTMKVYLAGRNNPYERQQAALDHRGSAERNIVQRLDPLRRKYFVKLLKWAQDTAPMRENSIADMGLGHPQIRRMLKEFGRRATAGGSISREEDVYWLEAQELDALADRLVKGEPLMDLASEVSRRKSKWEAMRHILPPTTLPKVKWMERFLPSGEVAGNTIKGFAASAGRVTARACVMLGPEDFKKMHAGDVIIAGITTPAWTPLFARASAIVTDIGGPLSHSSIVAREYGIPAVLATGIATRLIHDGQTVTVDGSAGIVSLN